MAWAALLILTESCAVDCLLVVEAVVALLVAGVEVVASVEDDAVVLATAAGTIAAELVDSETSIGCGHPDHTLRVGPEEVNHLAIPSFLHPFGQTAARAWR